MGEKLDNGIVLPADWPPRHRDPLSRQAMPVPYLDTPPELIPIDLGRQLFVDDFLVAETTLDRVFHQAQREAGNPVFGTDPEEMLAANGVVYLGHGGIFFDPDMERFDLFYVAGWRGSLNLATSSDLRSWSRPTSGVWKGNVVIDRSVNDHAIWLDLAAASPQERLKYLECHRFNALPEGIANPGHYLYTGDGKTWSHARWAGLAGDYCSFFYNPFRRVWVFSIKQQVPDRGRIRYYLESRSFVPEVDWSEAVYWTGADEFDLPEPKGSYHPAASQHPCQLYSLGAVAYESIMVGVHYIHRGPENHICEEAKIPKLTDLELGFSRDGFHWDRPCRTAFLAATRRDGDWDRAYLHSTTGSFATFADKLVFPYTGFSGVSPAGERGIYQGAAIGLAYLRRDGFASLDAGSSGGTLTTRPVVFNGSHLFVNAAVPRGRLRVEIRDLHGNPIPQFGLEDSLPLAEDAVLAPMRWQSGGNLAALAGIPVRFHFELHDGSLYAFWVSRDESGRSDGYVGAGGPGYDGVVDTIGKAAPKWSVA